MTYHAFRQAIEQELMQQPDGLTWKALRDKLDLPYERACPEWTARLEAEIGLDRTSKQGRALVWKLYSKR